MPLLPISFTQPLESLSNDQRDELAVALARASLRCVGDWPWGRLRLLKFLAEELGKDEKPRPQESRPGVLLN
jgi:hypothetical protein